MISRLPPGAVIIAGEDLDLLVYMVVNTQRVRQRDRLPPLRRLNQLAALLTAPGQADTPDEPVTQTDYVTTDQAADILGCSPRTARRLAPGLGGKLIGNRWVLDRQSINEHLDGKRTA